MPRLLNVIWPAIYINESFWKFWYLIIATIIIEFFALKIYLKFSWKKALGASLVGNLMSGIIGTFLIMFVMIGWHAVADNFIQGTFSLVNWFMTYLLMCLGSVLIEAKTVSIIYKVKLGKLFLPMLIGNLLTYIFIAFNLNSNAKEVAGVKKEKLLFVSDKVKFTLLDSSLLTVDTAFVEIWYNKANERVDNAKPKFRLQLPFNKQFPEIYNVSFKLLDEGESLGISNGVQQLFVDSLKTEYTLILEQKNIDPEIGWKIPVETDTFKIRKIK